uniref:Uncharacterized protein n=1 Tax=Meloidogyne incognita TaxID=6306 RepID=A0A914LQ00_MELIC
MRFLDAETRCGLRDTLIIAIRPRSLLTIMGWLELEGIGARTNTWLNRTAAGIVGGFGPKVWLSKELSAHCFHLHGFSCLRLYAVQLGYLLTFRGLSGISLSYFPPKHYPYRFPTQ